MEFIDGVVYINLDSREDRRQHMEEQFQKIPDALRAKVQRFSAIQEDGVGCMKSHAGAIRLAQASHWNSVLVLEDDFTWENPDDMPRILERFHQFWKDHESDFGLIQIAHGILFQSTPLNEASEIVRVQSACNAAGYWVHQRAYQSLIDVWDEAVEPLRLTGCHWLYFNDVVWDRVREQYPCYAFVPRIGYQCAGYSDLSKGFIEAR